MNINVTKTLIRTVETVTIKSKSLNPAKTDNIQ